jgi:hypothetical protein
VRNSYSSGLNVGNLTIQKNRSNYALSCMTTALERTSLDRSLPHHTELNLQHP